MRRASKLIVLDQRADLLYHYPTGGSGNLQAALAHPAKLVRRAGADGFHQIGYLAECRSQERAGIPIWATGMLTIFPVACRERKADAALMRTGKRLRTTEILWLVLDNSHRPTRTRFATLLRLD